SSSTSSVSPWTCPSSVVLSLSPALLFSIATERALQILVRAEAGTSTVSAGVAFSSLTCSPHLQSLPAGLKGYKMWWHMLLIPVLRKQRSSEFEASLVYRASSGTARATQKPCLKTKQNNNNKRNNQPTTTTKKKKTQNKT
ncbi:hypothetical protein LEMLEM_LOCUS27334, partial [Lemmus lemmus]